MNKKVECFKIQILKNSSKEEIFDVDKSESIFTIDCLQPYPSLNPTIIVADPFLFVHNDTLFLFYESKGLCTPGIIKMTCTKDLVQWSEPVTVLKENFHLSYPYVFQDADTVYMVPETGADGSVRIYEAVDANLTCWEFKKKLLIQPNNREIKMSYADSSVCKKDNIFYLMTTLQYADGVNTLELYYSDSLLGEYKAHPCSPIVRSRQLGRNAGCLQLIEGKLYRYSQDCTLRYGDNVNVSEVVELSPVTYKELLIKENIYPPHIPFYKNGGHQFNVACFCGKTIIGTDAKEYHYLLLQRIVNKLLKIVPYDEE